MQETSAGLLEASLLVPFCSHSDVVQAFSLALSWACNCVSHVLLFTVGDFYMVGITGIELERQWLLLSNPRQLAHTQNEKSASPYLLDEQTVVSDTSDSVDLTIDLAHSFLDLAGPLCALPWTFVESVACRSRETAWKIKCHRCLKVLFWRMICHHWGFSIAKLKELGEFFFIENLSPRILVAAKCKLDYALVHVLII